MSIATSGTAFAAEDNAIGQARAVLARAGRLLADREEWAPGARKAVLESVRQLTDSTETWGDLRTGRVRPADLFPGLEPGALDEALRQVAEDVAKDAGELVRVIGTHCGTEAAEEVRGEDKGEQ